MDCLRIVQTSPQSCCEDACKISTQSIHNNGSYDDYNVIRKEKNHYFFGSHQTGGFACLKSLISYYFIYIGPVITYDVIN